MLTLFVLCIVLFFVLCVLAIWLSLSDNVYDKFDSEDKLFKAAARIVDAFEVAYIIVCVVTIILMSKATPIWYQSIKLGVVWLLLLTSIICVIIWNIYHCREGFPYDRLGYILVTLGTVLGTFIVLVAVMIGVSNIDKSAHHVDCDHSPHENVEIDEIIEFNAYGSGYWFTYSDGYGNEKSIIAPVDHSLIQRNASGDESINVEIKTLQYCTGYDDRDEIHIISNQEIWYIFHLPEGYEVLENGN